MKKLFYIKTVWQDMLVSVDEHHKVRCFLEDEKTHFPDTEDKKELEQFLLNEYKNEPSWETGVSFEEMFEIMDTAKIIIEIEI